MKVKNLFGKGHILYCVDPCKLTIKLSNILQLLNKQIRTSTYENFQVEESIQTSFHHFPVEVEGCWYFETEDEARDFVKKQMGLSC